MAALDGVVVAIISWRLMKHPRECRDPISMHTLVYFTRSWCVMVLRERLVGRAT